MKQGNRGDKFRLTVLSIILILFSPMTYAVEVVNGSGNIKQESRQISAFKQLTITVPATVIFNNNSATLLAITADDNILPLIKSSVDGDHLRIETTGSFNTQHKLKITLGTKQLQQLNLSSTINLTLNQLQGERFTLSAEGQSHVNGNGNLDNLVIHLSGSHQLNFKNIQSNHVSLTTEGSNNVTLEANESLGMNLSGIATIRYSGKPNSINKQVFGIANIMEIDE